jgi:hypothetical protein
MRRRGGWPRALAALSVHRPCFAKRCASTGTNTLTFEPPSWSSGSRRDTRRVRSRSCARSQAGGASHHGHAEEMRPRRRPLRRDAGAARRPSREAPAATQAHRVMSNRGAGGRGRKGCKTCSQAEGRLPAATGASCLSLPRFGRQRRATSVRRDWSRRGAVRHHAFPVPRVAVARRMGKGERTPGGGRGCHLGHGDTTTSCRRVRL